MNKLFDSAVVKDQACVGVHSVIMDRAVVSGRVHSEGSVFKQLALKVNPIKLCKNASDGSFDPWRFVICKQGASNPCPPDARAGAISIVGSRTNVWNDLGDVKLEDASICGTTQLTGQVTVIRSILTEKSF